MGDIQKTTGLEILRQFVKTAPELPGVYRMIGAGDVVLYVGKAKSLRKRLTTYTQIERLPGRLQRMVMAIQSIAIVTTRSEAEALLLEANLVKSIQPRYNILLKDDKSFPYIALTKKHPYPRIMKYRGERNKDADYFGPYASAGDVNSAINSLQKAFLLRPCSDNYFKNRDRPCLEYHIKRCSAPCVEKISQPDYADLVAQATRFLNGKSKEVQAELEQQMHAASEAEAFERAAILRDRVRALHTIQSRTDIHTETFRNADIISVQFDAQQSGIHVLFVRNYQMLGSRSYFPAQLEGLSAPEILEAFIGRFYQSQPVPELILLNQAAENLEVLEEALSSLAGRTVTIEIPQRGEKRKLVDLAKQNGALALETHLRETAQHSELLEKLAQLFALPRTPQRIEVYDNSHLMGTNAVGAMIVATPDGFDPNAYRRFTVDAGGKNPDSVTTGGDDFWMLEQVLTRRLTRLKNDHPDYTESIWPDLLLIDGGKGQLSVVLEVFHVIGIEIPVVAISKGPNRNAGEELLHLPHQNTPISLAQNDPVKHYLQRLRDEAHRFAITSHRAKRSKSLTRSALDDIEGIGGARKKALLHYFGSVRAIMGASVEDLTQVPGISKKIAAELYRHLH